MLTQHSPHQPATELSVVVPLYNEEANVGELYRRLGIALESLSTSFEMVFVNDGSSDATAQMLDDLAERDRTVTVLHLSRNFGHQAAISAGIDHARGQAVILMDGDLQDPPEVLEPFVQAWRDGHDVVYAVRTRRKEGWGKRLAYALFYRLLRATSDLDIPLDSGDFCLMDRQVVEVLKHLPERQRFIRGLRTFVGFRQLGIPYERAARNAGEPKYTLPALVRLALDGLVGFSGWPVSLLTYLGITIVAIAVLATVGTTAVAGYWRILPSGWAVTALLVLYVGAFQLLGLGILGEYIRRIFLETKGRPTYIVRTARRQRSGRKHRNPAEPEAGTARPRHRKSGLSGEMR